MAFALDTTSPEFLMNHFKYLLQSLCPNDHLLLPETAGLGRLLSIEYLRIILDEAKVAELSLAAQVALQFRVLNLLFDLRDLDNDGLFDIVLKDCQSFIAKANRHAIDDYDIEAAIAEIEPMMQATAARIKGHISEHKTPDIVIPPEVPFTPDINEIGLILGKQLYLYLSSLESEKARCHALLIQGGHNHIIDISEMGPGRKYFNHEIQFYLDSIKLNDRAIIEKSLVAAANSYLSGVEPLNLSMDFDMAADDSTATSAAPTSPPPELDLPSSPTAYSTAFLPLPLAAGSPRALALSTASSPVRMSEETLASPFAFAV